MISCNKIYDTAGNIVEWFDGTYWRMDEKLIISYENISDGIVRIIRKYPIDMMGMSGLTWKWFRTGLLDDLPSQKHMDELAILLENKAKWMCDTFGGSKKTAPDYLNPLIKENKSKLNTI